MRVKSGTSFVITPSLGSKRDRLLSLLVQRSFQMADTPTFRLASGAPSRYYVDCKTAFSYPEARQLIGELMMERCKGLRFDAVGGLVMGAYPVAIAVSDAFYRHGQNEVRAFVIRKEPKKHGLRKRIEGDVKDGEKVLIVDDVITSGESTMEAIQQSREAGLEVSRAIAIIDREEQNGRQAIEAQGVKFEALFRLSDLSAAYQAQNG